MNAKIILRSLQKPEILFAVLATIFGVLSAFLVPQLSVSDENMHFLKSYSLAIGEFDTIKCDLPSGIFQRAGDIYNGNYSSDYSRNVSHDKKVSDKCGSASGYTPIMHMPQSIGVGVANLIHPTTGLMILFGRLANLAFYVTALYFVIKHLRVGKWAFVVTALSPLMLHLAGSLSSDVMNNVAIMAFVAFVINLFTKTSPLQKKDFITLLLLVALLAMTKMTNLVIMLPLIFLPAKLFANNKWKLPFNMQKWLLAAACLVVVLIVVYGWQAIYGASLISGTGVVVSVKQFLKILFNTYLDSFLGYTDVVFRGIVGEFASFRYKLPIFLVVVYFILLAVALLHKDKSEASVVKGSAGPLAIASLVTILLTIVSVSYAMYTVWATQPFRLGPSATYADGVQGRYYSAFLVILVPVFLYTRNWIQIKVKTANVMPMLVGATMFVILLYYTFFTYLLEARNLI